MSAPEHNLPSVAEVRRTATRALSAAGIEKPELDARILVGHALGLDHTGLVNAGNRQLSEAERTCVDALVARRLQHEPVARIIGEKEFWGLPFRVTRDVLVPRPDTETIVEVALAAVDATLARNMPLRIADLGTGTGALVLALLSELPCAYGVATDRSQAALAVAADNAHRFALQKRCGFVCCDFGAALSGGFDLVVSNPPYIASDTIAAVAAEVREHDPRLALDGGSEGLDAYKAIAADANRLLGPGGRLILELGDGQADAVTALFRGQSLTVSKLTNDLAGIPRALTVSR